MAVPVPPEYQAIVADLKSRASPKANGVAATGEAHLNGLAAGGAAPATNGVAAAPMDGGKESLVRCITLLSIRMSCPCTTPRASTCACAEHRRL